MQLNHKFPETFLARYALVTHTLVPYAVCRAIGVVQQSILDRLCPKTCTSLKDVDMAVGLSSISNSCSWSRSLMSRAHDRHSCLSNTISSWRRRWWSGTSPRSWPATVSSSTTSGTSRASCCWPPPRRLPSFEGRCGPVSGALAYSARISRDPMYLLHNVSESPLKSLISQPFRVRSASHTRRQFGDDLDSFTASLQDPNTTYVYR